MGLEKRSPFTRQLLAVSKKRLRILFSFEMEFELA